MADVDKCPHRWMHGVMTCPHCGNNDRSGTDVAALRAQLDDWRQFGFAQVGPPITCDQDLIDGIDKQLRQQADRIRALEAELAELRKREERLDIRRREGRGLLRRGMAQCFAVLRKGDMTRLSVWCTQVDDYLNRTAETRDILRSPRPAPERSDEEKR